MWRIQGGVECSTHDLVSTRQLQLSLLVLNGECALAFFNISVIQVVCVADWLAVAVDEPRVRSVHIGDSPIAVQALWPAIMYPMVVSR